MEPGRPYEYHIHDPSRPGRLTLTVLPRRDGHTMDGDFPEGRVEYLIVLILERERRA
jgi:hypothetical protein